MAQPYHFPKYRSAGLAPGHNQKLRNTSLIAQAREVCRLSLSVRTIIEGVV
jgi:hypothetical protein